MNRTAMSIVEEMERTGIMMSTTMTTEERTKGLLAFQDLILNEVFNVEHAEHLRIYDAVAHLRNLAIEKNVENDAVVLTAIRDLEIVSREISFAKSGASGEAFVAKNLRYVNRPMRTLSNITLREGAVLTELDQVIITSSGILILEVKNHKGALIINEAGQLCTGSGRPISYKVLGERMNAKRYLLRKKLEDALAKINPHLSLHIESRVVFSHPTASVTDNYSSEPFCYGARLVQEIQEFSSHFRYSDAEMQLFEELISDFAEAPARYNVGLDFDHIRCSFAEALVLLEGDTHTNEHVAPDEVPEVPWAYVNETCNGDFEGAPKEAPVVQFPTAKPTKDRAIATALALLGGLATVCSIAGATVLLSRKGA